MSDKLTKKSIRTAIDTLFWALSRACDRHTRDVRGIDLQSAFRTLESAARDGEKAHVRFGRRVLGHAPARSTPLETRVRYFVVKCILAGTRINSALDAYSVRDDYRIGAAIRDALAQCVPVGEAPQGGDPEDRVKAMLHSLDRERLHGGSLTFVPAEGAHTKALATFERIDYADHLA